ncbi:F-box/LRR-repeat protein At2g42730-like isoform X3 [Cornus florida]|uniref:F-box/LRR-repeat protein At2g42730-like isoform X3 n=1 Tax=Cornus florida TaxID=4283 RepID=UPI00289B58A6|nr:F-box/LRR-repeat protein At2g42730-like isoform X3 [Cornus florida]
MEKTSEKVDKGGLCLEDHISGLPDVVIVSILSLLTMKEAGRTSLLSKRWRYMWTHITGLNFDALHVIYEVLLGNKELEVERPLYLSWVNQVLKLYNGPSIDQFRVQFDLDESCRFDIDNWVNFAIEKRVKRLELDFPVSWGSTGYNFPDTGRITNHLHSLSLGFTICNSLTNLLLAHVNVTGQVLEYFLTNCPFLEQLSVEASDCLVNLKVPNVSIKLKCLEIIYCHYVESIEISAMNLVSFKYFGPKIGLPFKNLQEPVEMYIGGEYCKYLIYNFLGISSYLSQLESLTLHMNSIKLQLSKFVRRKRRRFTSRPHQYLKVVEFIGFAGLAIDVELAMYLIKSAVMLEKITFDPRNPLLIGSPWEFMETKEKKTARKRAKYLGTKLPAGVALVIL